MKTLFTNRNLFLFGLFLIAAGIPVSAFLMSMGQLILLGNWIIEGEWKRKWQIIKSSRLLWVLCSFYLLHVLGLLWTTDFVYATEDLKKKLPLLFFPLLFLTTKPLEKKETEALLWCFTGSVLVATFISTTVWLGLTKKKIVDIREISVFFSHIRFALMIVLSIFFLAHKLFDKRTASVKIVLTLVLIWLLCFLNILQAFTGITILVLVTFYYFVVFIRRRQNTTYRFIAIAVFITFAIAGATVLIRQLNKLNLPVKQEPLLSTTKSGNPYFTDTTRKDVENGNLVWRNFCIYELQKEWDRRSNIKFTEKDKKGNYISNTLVRYLSSKGFSKDSVGVSKLSVSDILWIQKGKGNYLYTNNSGIEARLYSLMNEYKLYKRGEDPTGHTFLMRLEFWRVGIDIVKRKWLYGVGTGDVQNAFYNQYKLSQSKLEREWQKRSHNQFLEVTVALGVLGLLVFLLYLFYPLFKIKNKHYLFGAFFLISVLSMLNEDTLETQAGVTFFGFFYGVLLTTAEEKKNQ